MRNTAQRGVKADLSLDIRRALLYHADWSTGDIEGSIKDGLRWLVTGERAAR